MFEKHVAMFKWNIIISGKLQTHKILFLFAFNVLACGLKICCASKVFRFLYSWFGYDLAENFIF